MCKDSIIEAISRLSTRGYADYFRAESGGLRAQRAGTLHQPEKMIIEDILRFDGDTDPGQEAIVFALRCNDSGTRGTYTVAFGLSMDEMDVKVVQRLQYQKSVIR